MSTEFLNTTIHHHTFTVRCACGYSAEVGIPRGRNQLVACPEGCGVTFIMRPAIGMFGHPELVEVTAPTIPADAPGHNKVDAAIDDCGQMADAAFAAEPGYYEQRMSEKLGVPVEQLRREMEEADEFGK